MHFVIVFEKHFDFGVVLVSSVYTSAAYHDVMIYFWRLKYFAFNKSFATTVCKFALILHKIVF